MDEIAKNVGIAVLGIILGLVIIYPFIAAYENGVRDGRIQQRRDDIVTLRNCK